MTPDQQARMALLLLRNMGPTRMQWLMGDREAPAVVEAMLKGRLPSELGPPPAGLQRSELTGWVTAIRECRRRVDGMVENHRQLGIRTLSPLEPGWPIDRHDPDPPALLFCSGHLGLLEVSPKVAIVGTRRCTALGRTVANRLGRDLAAAGSTVVSGLATGIDGAAHRGALGDTHLAIGVVGTGLDVVYPRANKELWDEVAQRGLLLSEVPLGTKPNRWRFPARNRLIAALADAVVVVESHLRGGALSTVDEAAARDRPVMAVPGSVLSPASDGTNALLVDGAVPVRDAADVLAYLGHSGARSPVDAAEAGRLFVPSETGSSDLPRRILIEVASGAIHLDRLVAATGHPISQVLSAVHELAAAGHVVVDGSTITHRASDQDRPCTG